MLTTPTGPSVSRIHQIAVPVRDPARALAFYRDVLGLRFLFEAPPALSFFDCGGVRLMLTRPEGVSEQHASIIYYGVDDIHEAATQLEARGVRFESGPQVIAKLDAVDVWLAQFRDSEGNILGLMSEVAR